MNTNPDGSQLQRELLKAGRTMAREGLVRGVWGNASVRSGPDAILITPSAMPYDALTADDLVLLDLEGRVRDGFRKPSSERQMHLAVYRARKDAGAVVHTHSVYASAFAAARREIPPVVEDVAQVVGGPVRVARYEHPGTAALGEAAVEALQERGAALLQNHGVIAVGPTLDEALRVAIIVEKAAQIAAIAAFLGPLSGLPPEAVSRLRRDYVHAYGQNK